MKLLYIARHFPPDGGGGVQRAAKFCKYLPGHHIFPTILTGNDPRTSRYVPEDLSMCAEVEGKADVSRVIYKTERPTVEEKVETLLAGARSLVELVSPDLILVTASPFEDLGIARTISRESGIPWVADLRDPWALDEFQVFRSRWHRQAAIRKMVRVLEGASLVIMNTPDAAARLQRILPKQRRPLITFITNGFDHQDFVEPVEDSNLKQFSIVHTGTLHAEKGLRQARWRMLYRIAGKVEPGVDLLGRSHLFLIRAIEQWFDEEPERREDVRVVLAGVLSDCDREIVDRSAIAPQVRMPGYLPHNESLRILRRSDLLFLPLHKVPPSSRTSIVPGKVYEYMASRRPILAAIPNGDARDFLIAAGSAVIVDPDDVGGICKALKKAYRNWAVGLDSAAGWNKEAVVKFERKYLTAQLAFQLQRVLQSAQAIDPETRIERYDRK